MKEALLYHRVDDDIRCDLCAHRCRVKPGLQGICLVRKNQDGVLYTYAYGRVAAQQVDPIEKKPLFHFLPGSRSFSIATIGCNFHCRYCQNWVTSQTLREDYFLNDSPASPVEIVQNAIRAGCKTISYTYTEPTIFFEYAYDTARLARRHGIHNIFVTNGYETPEAIDAIAPYLDAANVDLKAFSDSFYRKVVGATLDPVLQTLRQMKKRGIWLEVTTLIISGMNDNTSELRSAAEFIAIELGLDTPWHISRFFPAYRMADHPVTPISTILKSVEIGREAGLRYVYAGNVSTDRFENTYCPFCSALLVRRKEFTIIRNKVKNGACNNCGTRIAGMW